MNYVKKMCILRQVKQGFSADGKALTGLIKAEQYGKNIAVEVCIMNFAPLTSGEYFCLLSDGSKKTEMLALRGKSMFNLLTDMDISDGFCAVICHVKAEVIPIAYGVSGNHVYDWRAILNATLPPVFPKNQGGIPLSDPEEKPSIFPENTQEKQGETPLNTHANTESGRLEQWDTEHENSYDDERVAEENYYGEKQDERKQFEEVIENAYATGASEKSGTEEGANLTEDGDAPRVLHPFAIQPDGYYLAVKGEIDELFNTYPRDDTLAGAFACSEWVRVRGEAGAPQYLVGVLYEDGKASYICYALAAQDKDQPPEEIKKVCAFVPSSLFDDTKGFFVIFQSAASGECMKPKQA